MMHRILVDERRWIDERRYLHALNYCMLLPGPEAQQLATYVGWLLHGVRGGLVAGTLFVLPGALLTTWVTFVPCFLWIFLGAPYVERLRANARLSAALTAITAAVLGVIVNLAVWFGLHVLFGTLVEMEAGPLRLLLPAPESLDVWAAGLAIVAVVALLRLHLGLFWTLALCAALGVARGWLF
jgi:chromate transporter